MSHQDKLSSPVFQDWKTGISSGVTTKDFPMPGYTERSRRYLRMADEHTCRAEAAMGPQSRSMFLQLAKRYREMAGQIDDPAQWTTRTTILGSSSTRKASFTPRP
jgi:hypothetical protein